MKSKREFTGYFPTTVRQDYSHKERHCRPAQHNYWLQLCLLAKRNDGVAKCQRRRTGLWTFCKILSPSRAKILYVDSKTSDEKLFSDLSKMIDVFSGSILHVLRGRFGKDDIYTWLGQILIALNPFKQISGR